MRDIILITPQCFSLGELASVFEESASFSIVVDGKRISIEKLPERDFVEFEKVDGIRAYYDDEEGGVFKDQISEPNFYIARFKDIKFLKLVLEKSLDRSDIYIDNDVGLILPGTQFVALIRQRPDWDWALD